MGTTRQQVLELNVDLEKAKAPALMAEEAVEASRLASYKQGVQETKVQLVDELAEVCKDYCKEVWLEALNLVGFFTTSEWREVRKLYYPYDICEVPADLPSSPALAPISIV